MEEDKSDKADDIILFNNSPLGSKEDDAFDFNIKITAIKKAIKENAKIIALVGDYGTGKSSLTNILYSDNRNSFEKPIYINLWDCVYSKEKETEDFQNNDKINSFTKSFLYQLAAGNKKKSGFTKYINQRLSKNYGKISLSIPKTRCFIFLCIAIFFVLLFWGLKNSSCNIEVICFKHNIPIFNELYLFLAVPFFFFAFKNNNFLFSLWDSQGKIEPTDTDCFEIFKEIISFIKPKKSKKQLIVIEDLDRTDDAEIVVSLLKELYRFLNLLSEEDKENFVFIVSLKSEESLIDKSNKENTKIDSNKSYQESLNIYSKVFDYTVWIRPLHFENVREIVKQLLDSQMCEEKTKIILPQLYWIMQGENLTVREIKDRLNETFLLYYSLSKRNENNTDIKFNKCSAVVYMQRQFPVDFQRLILNEKLFSQIVKNYYYNEEKPDENKLISENDMQNKGKVNSDFVKDFNEMLKQKDIDNDYTMYFFNYPKNAHIMTLEEKTVYDAIIHNNSDFSPNEINNRIVQKLIDENRTNIIKDALNESMEYKHLFAEVIFNFEQLFSIAIKEHTDYTIQSISQFYTDNYEKDEGFIYVSRICNYECVSTNQFLKGQLITMLLNKTLDFYIKNKNRKYLERFRINVITNFSINISKFSKVFINEILPIVDINTLKLLKSSSNIFNCLNFSLINQNNYKEYFEYLLNLDFSDEDKPKLLCELNKIPNLDNISDSHILLKQILKKNHLYDKSLFSIIYSKYQSTNDKKEIIDYVQNINFNNLLLEELKQIDELYTFSITDLKLIELLEQNNLFNSSVYSRLQLNDFNNFNFKSEWLKDNISQLGTLILQENPKLFAKLKEIFIGKNSISKIYTLFNEPFEFASENEIAELESKDLYWITDFKRVTIERTLLYANYCNNKRLNGNMLYDFFEALFFGDDKDINRITSKEVTNKLLLEINFSVCKFDSLSSEKKDKIISIFTHILGLENFENAIVFLSKIKCHIDSLDKLIQENINSEDELFKKYITICNSISNPTDLVLDYLGTKNINFPLTSKITDGLLNKNYFVPYIIGKSLLDKCAFYTDTIPLEMYFKAYFTSDEYFELAKESTLIKLFYNNKLYNETLDLNRLKPFMQFRQTYKLLELCLCKINSAEEKKEYISNIKDIDTYEDSSKFIDLITGKQYISLFHNDKHFREIVKEKLWEIDPTGRKKKGVLKRIFTNKLNKSLMNYFNTTE